MSTWKVVDLDRPEYRGPDVSVPTLAAAVSILPGYQVAEIHNPEGRRIAIYHLFTGLEYVDPRPTVRQ
jgi:hypothetical protein